MKTILKLPLRLVSSSLASWVLQSCVFFLPALATAAPNVPPTVAIQSAAMRHGTTLMDVVYQVNDPDDATVKVRALAFVNGVRSFANVIRPVTWAEGTEANLGDAITTNVNHTLTWDVAADWNIQLGQVKMEVLAVDSNGMLPFDGITIPAAAGQPELTINQIGPSDTQVLNPLFWFYASGNDRMDVANGTLIGSVASGIFQQLPVVVGSTLNQQFAQPFLFKLMDISPATTAQLTYADAATRTTFVRNKWLTTNRPNEGTQLVYAWGNNNYGQLNIPAIVRSDSIAIVLMSSGLALQKDGTLAGWGGNVSGELNIPAGLSGVTKLVVGGGSCYALKSDGTVVAWGLNSAGQTDVPPGLSGVSAIAAGWYHVLALKSDGTVVGWGSNADGQINVPAGLSGVTAIAAGWHHSLALKNDGTVVVWGGNGQQGSLPVGLSGVTAIAAGSNFSLALKNDGTVVDSGGYPAPAGLSGVTAIAAGHEFCLALKSDGTVVGWGANESGQITIPSWLTGVTAIGAHESNGIAIIGKP